jgi:hypothetical protein
MWQTIFNVGFNALLWSLGFYAGRCAMRRKIMRDGVPVIVVTVPADTAVAREQTNVMN